MLEETVAARLQPISCTSTVLVHVDGSRARQRVSCTSTVRCSYGFQGNEALVQAYQKTQQLAETHIETETTSAFHFIATVFSANAAPRPRCLARLILLLLPDGSSNEL